jgi:hypothetical protein
MLISLAATWLLARRFGGLIRLNSAGAAP